MDHSMQTNLGEAGSEGILKNFLLKMPLIDFEKQGGSLSNKQMRNFKKYNDLQGGDGLFSGLSNLITPAVNFIKSNADVIKTGTQAISNVSTAGKNIKHAINATKKTNAEIEQLKRIKEYTKLKNKKPNIIKYEPNLNNQTSTTNSNNQTSTTNKLDAQQKAAIQSLAKNLS